MTHFEGRLTPAIYRRALGITLRSLRSIAVTCIVVSLISLPEVHAERTVSWSVPLFLGMFGVLLLLNPWMAARRVFATDRLIGEPFTGEADEQGIRFESAHGRADLPWTTMHKVVVTSNLVALYQSAVLFRMVPREFFADEESWQGFRALASAAPTASRPRSLLWTPLLWIAIIIVVFVLWTLFKRT